MRKILGVAVVFLLLAGGVARADAQAGISLGARLGYGIPLGDADASITQSDLVSGVVPLQLDATYRFNPSWQLGLYFQYGFNTGIGDQFCTSGGTLLGASCSNGSTVRFGAEGMYTFPSDGFSPWIGLGLGFEWLNTTVTYLGQSADIQLSGFEFLNLQLGGDWKVSPGFKMGPFVSFSMGSYSTISAAGVSGSIASTSTHEWLQLGLKGTFDL